MEWKSCKNYLPIIFEPCIIYIEGKEVAEDAMAVFAGDVWFWWIDGVADEVEGKVTHWTYRPKPPKENEDA